MQNKKGGILKVTAMIVVCVAVLFVVNLVCSPIIESNNASSKFEPLLEVMPDAKDFETLYDVNDPSSSSLTDVADTVVAVYKETSSLGYVVLLSTTQGFTHEPINFTVAFTTEGVISGIALTNYPETRDFGKEYPATYLGADSTMATVSLVSGCTYSSSAFKNATVDAFNVLIANNLMQEAKKSDEQLLTEMLPELFNSMVTFTGVGQYEELAGSGDMYKVLKANNGGGFACFVKDGDKTVLALVNNSDCVKVVDSEGNDVTADYQTVADSAVSFATNDRGTYSDANGEKKISTLGNGTATSISLGNVFNSVTSAYKVNGNYGFVVKTYGYGNEVMTSYFIIDNSGKIVSMSVDEIILHSDYFESYTLDEPSYKAGFVGLDGSTYSSEVSIISGATVSSNAIDMAAKSALEAYSIIKGE